MQSTFGSRVAAKLGMGDVRGAVNIVTSKESILPPTQETKELLQVKHPPRKRSVHLDAPSSNGFSNLNDFRVTKADVKWRIASFKKGAAGAQCVELALRWHFCVHGSICHAIYISNQSFE